jgi:hypothetical protein
VNFEDLDWTALDRLRELFLSGRFPAGGYWRSLHDLHQYNATFAERIGWKWDAVLGELADLAWTPPGNMTRVIDWGCGSGVAGRRLLRAFPQLNTLEVFDSSPLAVEFTLRQASREFPTVLSQPFAGSDASGSVLVISHVWNELDAPRKSALIQLIRTAAAVLWVEPGTHEVARALQAARETLLEDFHVVAPCTHQAPCGLLAPGMDRHWCHHFANPPTETFTTGDWARFAERAGIDLRSLPYSYLVLQNLSSQPIPNGEPGWERIIGRARISKPMAKVFSCGTDGAHEVEITRRHLPDWFKAFKRDTAPGRAQWIREGNRIVAAQAREARPTPE